MSLNLGRQMILFCGLFLLLLICENQANEANDDGEKPVENSDEDDTSSEETIEADSKDESTRRRRRRRFADISTNNNNDDASKNMAGTPRIAIPGLPDPAAILKIAEILQTVGEKVVPILIEGIPKADFVSDRISKDLQFLRNLKQEIDLFSGEFKLRK